MIGVKLLTNMTNIRIMRHSVLQCKYTHFKPAERCVEEKHDYHWHDAVKRFFKCPCGQRKISLSRFPTAACRYAVEEAASWCLFTYVCDRKVTMSYNNGPGMHVSLTDICIFCFSNCGVFKWERDGMLKVPRKFYCFWWNTIMLLI